MTITREQVIEHVAGRISDNLLYADAEDTREAQIAWARHISDEVGFTIHTPGHQEGWWIAHENVTITAEEAGRAYDMAKEWER